MHHFAPQLSSPFPLLAAMAARTSRIEIGTGVIDMRYENPLYMAEEAAAADLISGGRLQLGVSRGSPETALRRRRGVRLRAAGGRDRRGPRPREAPRCSSPRSTAPAWSQADPRMTGRRAAARRSSRSRPGLAERIWWGAGTRATAGWAAEQGMNLQCSTLLTEDTGVPFDELQAEQIALYRAAWAEAGHDWTPRVSVSRSVMPIIDRRRPDATSAASAGLRGPGRAGSTAATPASAAATSASRTGSPRSSRRDAAVQAADTVLLTVPNQLGVDYNAHLLATIAEHIAPAIGWRPASMPA